MMMIFLLIFPSPIAIIFFINDCQILNNFDDLSVGRKVSLPCGIGAVDAIGRNDYDPRQHSNPLFFFFLLAQSKQLARCSLLTFCNLDVMYVWCQLALQFALLFSFFFFLGFDPNPWRSGTSSVHP